MLHRRRTKSASDILRAKQAFDFGGSCPSFPTPPLTSTISAASAFIFPIFTTLTIATTVTVAPHRILELSSLQIRARPKLLSRSTAHFVNLVSSPPINSVGNAPAAKPPVVARTTSKHCEIAQPNLDVLGRLSLVEATVSRATARIIQVQQLIAPVRIRHHPEPHFQCPQDRQLKQHQQRPRRHPHRRRPVLYPTVVPHPSHLVCPTVDLITA